MTTINITSPVVTALLNPMVGDTGSGGTQGLVPAPASGTAEAGKFLKADGTWAVPAGGGGGATTLDDLIDVATSGASNGDVLTYNGSSWEPAAGAGDGETLTASGSASLAFTGLSGTVFRLIGQLLVPATDNVELCLRFGTGGSPTYITSGYHYASRYVGDDGSTGVINSGSADHVQILSGISNAAGLGASFDLTVVTDNSGQVRCFGTCSVRSSNTHDYVISLQGNVALPSAALSAIELYCSSGNISTGKATLTAGGGGGGGGGGGASALDDLTDVTITSPSSGQALVWDGSAWVNGPFSSFGLATKTANYTVTTGDSELRFDNIGAAGEVDFTLPAAARGLKFGFLVDASHTVKLICNGSDNIAVGGGTPASTLQSSTPYSFVLIEAHKAGVWVVTSLIGSWS